MISPLYKWRFYRWQIRGSFVPPPPPPHPLHIFCARHAALPWCLSDGGPTSKVRPGDVHRLPPLRPLRSDVGGAFPNGAVAVAVASAGRAVNSGWLCRRRCWFQRAEQLDGLHVVLGGRWIGTQGWGPGRCGSSPPDGGLSHHEGPGPTRCGRGGGCRLAPPCRVLPRHSLGTPPPHDRKDRPEGVVDRSCHRRHRRRRTDAFVVACRGRWRRGRPWRQLPLHRGGGEG